MAADKRVSRTRVARRRRRALVAGLVAFAAVDVLLVAAAVTRGGSSGEPGASGSSAPASVTLPSDTGSPAAPETPEASPEPTADAAAVVAPARLLSAVDSRTAWRSSRGACPAGEAPVLERTDDGGTTWRSVQIGTDQPAALDRVQAQDAATVFVVGATAGTCEPVFAQTFTSGEAFRTYPDRLAASWYVAAAYPATVHSPSGAFAAPCAVVTSLAVTDDSRAAVLCADGQLRATADGAATWGAAVPAPGVVDLTASSTGYLLAGTGGSCEGVAVSSWAATGGVLTDVGCASGAAPAAGQLAVAARAGSAWLWSGDDVLVSTDGGASW